MASVLSRAKYILAGIPRRAARGLVTIYRYTFSPLVGFHCRHLPTCSAYADQALERFGLWAGGWMTLARLCAAIPGAPPASISCPSAFEPMRTGTYPGATPAGAAPTPLRRASTPLDPRSFDLPFSVVYARPARRIRGFPECSRPRLPAFVGSE